MLASKNDASLSDANVSSVKLSLLKLSQVKPSQVKVVPLNAALPEDLAKYPTKYQGFDEQFQRSFFISMTLIAILTIALPIAISSFTTGAPVLPKTSEVAR